MISVIAVLNRHIIVHSVVMNCGLALKSTSNEVIIVLGLLSVAKRCLVICESLFVSFIFSNYCFH